MENVMTFPFHEVVSISVIREDRFHICLKRVHFNIFQTALGARATAPCCTTRPSTRPSTSPASSTPSPPKASTSHGPSSKRLARHDLMLFLNCYLLLMANKSFIFPVTIDNALCLMYLSPQILFAGRQGEGRVYGRGRHRDRHHVQEDRHQARVSTK